MGASAYFKTDKQEESSAKLNNWDSVGSTMTT